MPLTLDRDWQRDPQAAADYLAMSDFPLREVHPDILRQMVRAGLEVRRTAGGKIEFHPLGFARVSFPSARLSDGCHVHYWSKEIPKREGTELPHAHAFDMQSVVLHGGLKNILWSANADDGGKFSLVPFDSQPDQSAFVYDHMRRVSVHETETEIVEAGSSYSMPAAHLHTTAILQDPTVTLIRKQYQNNKKSFAVLAADASPTTGPFLHHTEYTTLDVWKRLQDLLQG